MGVWDEQPVALLVKIKPAVPGEIPSTLPLLLIFATDGLLDVHTPPIPGNKVVVLSGQIEAGPDRLTNGYPLTVKIAEESE